MSNHNKYPTTGEQETFAHQEMVQYNDGGVALCFRTPGDVLKLGYDSTFKYARFLHSGGSGNMAIVKTKSGNAYVIGQGIVINARERKAYRLPDELPEIEIGKSWLIPGVQQTSDIEEVQFRYKTAPDGYGEVQVDRPSPFPALKAQLELIREQMLAQQ